MKKIILVLGMATVLGMYACAGEDAKETTTYSEGLSELPAEEDLYVGEYNSFDTDEPNLHIRKNEDGTYAIEIVIFRLTSLYCIGHATETGIEFKENDRDVYGKITLEGDVATVSIESPDWLEDIRDYEYYKLK